MKTVLFNKVTPKFFIEKITLSNNEIKYCAGLYEDSKKYYIFRKYKGTLYTLLSSKIVVEQINQYGFYELGFAEKIIEQYKFECPQISNVELVKTIY